MSIESINGSRAGVIGGTLVAVVGNLPVEEIWSTIILAAVGAVASFLATVFCKSVVGWLRGRKRPK